ncbi:MAG: DNA-binding protein [Deltaproteobacteria bacterium]|nr:DNA-binding protein [Deltaproteobacteria bacterium]
MKKEGSKSRTIFTDKLHIESKTLFVDLKENDGGKFLQIAELSNARRSTVVIPFSGFDAFMETLQRIVAGEGVMEGSLPGNVNEEF